MKGEMKSKNNRASFPNPGMKKTHENSLSYISNLEAKLLEGIKSPSSPLTKYDWKSLRTRVRRRLEQGM